MNTKINYCIDPDSEDKLLPFQYYDLYNLITIPILSNDKRPFLKEWNKTKQTIHPTHIDQNIGILTGKVNNITVLDIDQKDNGMDHWKEISKQYKDIKTPTSVSTSGGLHLYFKYNTKLKTMYRIKVNNDKIGWDIKSNDSMVIAPPSMINGKKYKWQKNKSLDDLDIINMPKWLERYIIDHLK